VKKSFFGGKGRPSGDGDYARYQIFKVTKQNPLGTWVEDVIGLKKAEGRRGYLMRGLPRDGDTQFVIRPVSGVGQGRMAWGTRS
jgi:hypothetical protein